jgi:hypothetical protein
VVLGSLLDLSSQNEAKKERNREKVDANIHIIPKLSSSAACLLFHAAIALGKDDGRQALENETTKTKITNRRRISRRRRRRRIYNNNKRHAQ